MARPIKKRSSSAVAQQIKQGLTELRDVLRRGERLEKHFKVNVVEIPDPPHFNAARVKQLRQRLRITQGIFAKVVGVSVELIEHWEQGIRNPRAMACRLLNEIEKDPAGFMERLPVSGRAA